MTDSKVIDVDFSSSQKIDILHLFCVLDLKTKKYMPPFFASNIDEAKRAISNTVNYSNSLINKFPSDYELYLVGDFDQSTGLVFASSDGNFVKYLVCNLSELKQDDTVKYDELKKETQTLQLQIQSVLKDYEDKEALYEKKLRELSTVEDFIKAKHIKDNDVDCFPVEKKKLAMKKRRSILDLLTGN